MMSMASDRLLPALVLALGLAIGGGLVGWASPAAAASDRFVEVKGLAEREVSADLALWPLRFVASGNDSSRRPRRRLREAQSR